MRWWKRRRELHPSVQAVLPYQQAWVDNGWAMLPTSVLAALMDKQRVNEIWSRDRELLVQIEQDILATGGIREQLEIVHDPRGLILRDGHHRVLIAEQHGMRFLPVFFSKSPGIPKTVVPYEEFAFLLAEALQSMI